MRGGLSVRINSKQNATRPGGGQHGAAAYALLSAASSDVDSKRHRKDPFNTRYVQLCLSDFGQVRFDCWAQRLRLFWLSCRTRLEQLVCTQTESIEQGDFTHDAAVAGVAENLHVRIEVRTASCSQQSTYTPHLDMFKLLHS